MCWAWCSTAFRCAGTGYSYEYKQYYGTYETGGDGNGKVGDARRRRPWDRRRTGTVGPANTTLPPSA